MLGKWGWNAVYNMLGRTRKKAGGTILYGVTQLGEKRGRMIVYVEYNVWWAGCDSWR